VIVLSSIRGEVDHGSGEADHVLRFRVMCVRKCTSQWHVSITLPTSECPGCHFTNNGIVAPVSIAQKLSDSPVKCGLYIKIGSH